MKPLTLTVAPPDLPDAKADLQQLAAEAMGWQPLESGAYARQGNAATPTVVHVVGLPDLALNGLDVLLLQG